MEEGDESGLIGQFISLSPPVPVSPLYWISFLAPLPLCVFALFLVGSKAVAHAYPRYARRKYLQDGSEGPSPRRDFGRGVRVEAVEEIPVGALTRPISHGYTTDSPWR